jgi:hypothetical protein
MVVGARFVEEVFGDRLAAVGADVAVADDEGVGASLRHRLPLLFDLGVVDRAVPADPRTERVLVADVGAAQIPLPNFLLALGGRDFVRCHAPTLVNPTLVVKMGIDGKSDICAGIR